MTAIADIDTNFVTVKRVCGVFHTEPVNVNRWCRLGKFPNAIKPGKRWLIPESDVVALLKSGWASGD
jgi:predicted site-specific integrase-resolvase